MRTARSERRRRTVPLQSDAGVLTAPAAAAAAAASTDSAVDDANIGTPTPTQRRTTEIAV